MTVRLIAVNKINLKLILVTGHTHEFHFYPSDSVSFITQHVYNNWPADWAENEKPPTNILRLIYQGRFLHGNVTLGGLRLLPGKVTAMHLVARENLPEPKSQNQMKKEKSNEGCCNLTCTVL